MELANIEKLVDKYLEAQTSLEEEKRLHQYFTSSSDIPTHLQQYRVLFSFYQESKNETFNQNIELKTKKKKNFQWISIAASIVLLISVFVGKQEYDKYQQRKQFAQIKEALQMVSVELNRGNDAIYAMSSNLSKANTSIHDLNMFSKTLNTAQKIINNK